MVNKLVCFFKLSGFWPISWFVFKLLGFWPISWFVFKLSGFWPISWFVFKNFQGFGRFKIPTKFGKVPCISKPNFIKIFLSLCLVGKEQISCLQES